MQGIKVTIPTGIFTKKRKVGRHTEQVTEQQAEVVEECRMIQLQGSRIIDYNNIQMT